MNLTKKGFARLAAKDGFFETNNVRVIFCGDFSYCEEEIRISIKKVEE